MSPLDNHAYKYTVDLIKYYKIFFRLGRIVAKQHELLDEEGVFGIPVVDAGGAMTEFGGLTVSDSLIRGFSVGILCVLGGCIFAGHISP